MSHPTKILLALLLLPSTAPRAEDIKYSIAKEQAARTFAFYSFQYSRCLWQWQGWLLRNGERNRDAILSGSVAHCQSIMELGAATLDGDDCTLLPRELARRAEVALDTRLSLQ